jgi:hypothetical protein
MGGSRVQDVSLESESLHFVLRYKRIELGRFRFQSDGDEAVNVRAIEAAELALVLEGIDLQGARRRPRWQPRRQVVEGKVSRSADRANEKPFEKA